MTIEVVSVHFPKAGGNSLYQSCVAAYGSDAVYQDYADAPADPCCQYSLDPDACRRKAREFVFAPGVRVVHGHFHPSKYEFITGAKWITFLRHPVDNLISIYYYWKTLETGNCILDYFRNYQLALPDLARLPLIRYLLSRTFFGGVDMNTFDFIGFMENYTEDMRKLSHLLSIPLVESRENINKYPGYQDEVSAVKADKQLMSTLHDYLIEDIKFYERLKTSRGAT